MSESFVEKNKNLIKKLEDKIATTIKSLNISTNDSLSFEVCFKLVGEITKAIKNVKSLADALNAIPDDDRTAVSMSIIIYLLKSESVKELLSPQQVEQIEKFVNNKEAVDTVLNLVDWVADTALESLDINNDGVVTDNEVEKKCNDFCLCVNNCGGGEDGCECYKSGNCCGCCTKLVKSLASCWSCFFIKVLCCKCSSSQVKYEK